MGKVPNKSEDRYLTEKQIIGVADGVGSWSKYGYDSGSFAQNLLANCLLIFQRQKSQGSTESNSPGLAFPLDMYSVIEMALEDTIRYGSATLILAKLEGTILKIYSIGDSKLVIFRGENGEYEKAF